MCLGSQTGRQTLKNPKKMLKSRRRFESMPQDVDDELSFEEKLLFFTSMNAEQIIKKIGILKNNIYCAAFNYAGKISWPSYAR